MFWCIFNGDKQCPTLPWQITLRCLKQNNPHAELFTLPRTSDHRLNNRYGFLKSGWTHTKAIVSSNQSLTGCFFTLFHGKMHPPERPQLLATSEEMRRSRICPKQPHLYSNKGWILQRMGFFWFLAKKWQLAKSANFLQWKLRPQKLAPWYSCYGRKKTGWGIGTLTVQFQEDQIEDAHGVALQTDESRDGCSRRQEQWRWHSHMPMWLPMVTTQGMCHQKWWTTKSILSLNEMHWHVCRYSCGTTGLHSQGEGQA